MVMFLLIKKKKIIAVIINTRNSGSDFYFGHFIVADGIPQSCMPSFSSHIQMQGKIKNKVVLNFIYY